MKQKTAFSLLELSVVLVVISIIVAGILSASTVSVRNAKVNVTKDRLEAIYKALGVFVQKNYRLPCPAALRIAKGGLGYGSSVGSAGACADNQIYQADQQNSILYGMVPVAALGLSSDMAEDGFGNKIIYVVNKNFTAADYPSTALNSYFSSYEEVDPVTTIGAIEAASESSIDGNAFVLISHGANGYGAFAANLATQSTTTSSDVYEQQNYISTVNTATTPYTADFGLIGAFTDSVKMVYSNPTSDVFDDIVFFRSRSQMIEDFDLMFLIPCLGDADYTTSYYGQTAYRTAFCTSPTNVKASKKCGPFGNWITEQTCAVD